VSSQPVVKDEAHAPLWPQVNLPRQLLAPVQSTTHAHDELQSTAAWVTPAGVRQEFGPEQATPHGPGPQVTPVQDEPPLHVISHAAAF
jgi:hypothetical protein